MYASDISRAESISSGGGLLCRLRAAVIENRIRAAEAALGVPMDYLRFLARHAPKLLHGMNAIGKLRRRAGGMAPPHLLHAACLGGMLADDCGECVQITVNLARAGGVPAEHLRAALANDLAALPMEFALALRFGRAIAENADDCAELHAELAARHGPGAVAEIAFAVALGRSYPALKRGLGMARSCALVGVRA